MSFRRRSPRLILAFVAMGRERPPSGVADDPEESEDNFLEPARDWFARGDRFAKPSNEGDFG